MCSLASASIPMTCGRKAATMAALRRAGPKHSPQPVVPSSQITSTRQLARLAVLMNDQPKGCDNLASSTCVMTSAMRIGCNLCPRCDKSRQPGCCLTVDRSGRRLPLRQLRHLRHGLERLSLHGRTRQAADVRCRYHVEPAGQFGRWHLVGCAPDVDGGTGDAPLVKGSDQRRLVDQVTAC